MTALLPTEERSWQSWVTDCAKLMGWRWAHFRPARTVKGWRTAAEGTPGFPDLVLLRPPRLIVAELKTRKRYDAQGKVREQQQLDWLADRWVPQWVNRHRG